MEIKSSNKLQKIDKQLHGLNSINKKKRHRVSQGSFPKNQKKGTTTSKWCDQGTEVLAKLFLCAEHPQHARAKVVPTFAKAC